MPGKLDANRREVRRTPLLEFFAPLRRSGIQLKRRRDLPRKLKQIQAKAGPLPSLDALIAATAIIRHLTLVTHNTQDMARTGALILDPWAKKPSEL